MFFEEGYKKKTYNFSSVERSYLTVIVLTVTSAG